MVTKIRSLASALLFSSLVFGCSSSSCPAPTCAELGQDCTGDADCCGDSVCSEGTCAEACIVEGDPCTDDFQCCGDALCVDGTCGTPPPAVDCDCACYGAASWACNDPALPGFCAGNDPVPGGQCETALIEECGFTPDDIAALPCF